MMKHLILLLLLLTPILGYSQMEKKSTKKIYYFDTDSHQLNKDNFWKKYDFAINLYKTIENDTAVFLKLYHRKHLGKLIPKENKQLRTYLEKITHQKINPKQTIIIDYFLENPYTKRVIKHYTKNKSYLKEIEKNPNLIQFFITENTVNYPAKKRQPVFNDEKNIFKKVFFNKYPEDFLNYLILKPDGSYLKFYGEYMQQNILKESQKDWELLQKN